MNLFNIYVQLTVLWNFVFYVELDPKDSLSLPQIKVSEKLHDHSWKQMLPAVFYVTHSIITRYFKTIQANAEAWKEFKHNFLLIMLKCLLTHCFSKSMFPPINVEFDSTLSLIRWRDFRQHAPKQCVVINLKKTVLKLSQSLSVCLNCLGILSQYRINNINKTGGSIILNYDCKYVFWDFNLG